MITVIQAYAHISYYAHILDHPDKEIDSFYELQNMYIQTCYLSNGNFIVNISTRLDANFFFLWGPFEYWRAVV